MIDNQETCSKDKVFIVKNKYLIYLKFIWVIVLLTFYSLGLKKKPQKNKQTNKNKNSKQNIMYEYMYDATV